MFRGGVRRRGLTGGDLRLVGDLYRGERLRLLIFGEGERDMLLRYFRTTNGDGDRDHLPGDLSKVGDFACLRRANITLFCETNAAERGESCTLAFPGVIVCETGCIRGTLTVKFGAGTITGGIGVYGTGGAYGSQLPIG